ncbi:MAG: hypothetical protein DCC65_15645 [Planctomycetota bacterium]|nr:MAG: hypothetical protein DCC65_15645 [Planctomycetota bacterium]
MKRKLASLALLAIVMIAPAVGCGVATTQQENNRMLSRVADYDARMLVDDIALFAQTNRPFRGSRYVID